MRLRYSLLLQVASTLARKHNLDLGELNGCELPAGWSTIANSGDSTWLFVLNSPDLGNPGNIDGTCMALFDAITLGQVHQQTMGNFRLPLIYQVEKPRTSFDYNYFHLGASSFTVDVWDGAAWVNVLTETESNVGAWGAGPPYANAVIPLTGYLMPTSRFDSFSMIMVERIGT